MKSQKGMAAMKRWFLSSLILATVGAGSATAGEDLEGKPIRLVCFKSDVAGEMETADLNYVIIAQQVGGTDKLDLADFSTRNLSKLGGAVAGPGLFDLHFFSDASAVIGRDAPSMEHEELASALLEAEPDEFRTYVNLEGDRLRFALQIDLPNSRGWLMWNPERANMNDFIDYEISNSPIEGPLIHIACHPPFRAD